VKEFRAAVEATPFHTPSVPVIANISARPLRTVEEIRNELAGQLTWPVRWVSSVQWMVGQGVNRFIEVGPKNVLSKLVKWIDGTVEAASVGDVASAEALVGPAEE